MNTLENQAPAVTPAQFPPLESVTAPNVPTEQAAFYLIRKSQTLRKWACLENGPIRPIRINGRLAWRVADIKSLVAGGAQ
jgi:hypothetical protein